MLQDQAGKDRFRISGIRRNEKTAETARDKFKLEKLEKTLTIPTMKIDSTQT